MSCFGGTPVALKEEYLKNTPFFLLAAETDDATILPELAKYAKVAKVCLPGFGRRRGRGADRCRRRRARAPEFRGRARVAELGLSAISFYTI